MIGQNRGSGVKIANQKLNVGIVCENEILRFGLRVALTDLKVVESLRELRPNNATSVNETFRSLDVVMVSYTEWATAQRVVSAAHASDVRVLAFIDDTSAKDPEKLVSLRPDGFILQRELNKNTLEEALVKVSRSETAVPAEIISEVFNSAARVLKTSHLRFIELTSREKSALELLADGLSNKEIAKNLNISLHGAKRLVGNILLKLNCPNRTQAVVLAMRYGLVGEGK